MPVLFWEEPSSSRALAYTNNHVNCLVDGSTVLTAQSHGPVVQYDPPVPASDILGDYVDAMFQKAGYQTVTDADELNYHNYAASIHCGTNVQRRIPSYNWWDK